MESPYLTLNYDSTPEEIAPGVLLFDDCFSISEQGINFIDSIYSKNIELDKDLKQYMKNSIFSILKKNNQEELIVALQKVVLNSLAKYCDYYPESIHSLQWQESYQIILDEPGSMEEVFNPSASSIDEDKNIISTPFSRQLVAELCIDDSSNNREYNFMYFDGEENYSASPGSLIIYPANFLWSRKKSNIIYGRKVYLRTFFNGGKDFAADKDVHDSVDNLFYSYMR